MDHAIDILFGIVIAVCAAMIGSGLMLMRRNFRPATTSPAQPQVQMPQPISIPIDALRQMLAQYDQRVGAAPAPQPPTPMPQSGADVEVVCRLFLAQDGFTPQIEITRAGKMGTASSMLHCIAPLIGAVQESAGECGCPNCQEAIKIANKLQEVLGPNALPIRNQGMH